MTTPARTLLACLRTLPFDEALAVADSALRVDGCRQLLTHLADTTAGPGGRQLRRVAREASASAANPFESVTRAISLDVRGLQAEPQVEISDDGFIGRLDLADRRRMIVIEADSFEHHGTPEGLARDARRYNRLVVAGWLVLRFTYEDVMNDPVGVRAMMRRGVAATETRTKRA